MPESAGVKARGPHAILMENGNTAQIAARPFLLVPIHLRVNRLQEGPDEGSFPRRPSDGTLVPDIFDCVTTVSGFGFRCIIATGVLHWS